MRIEQQFQTLLYRFPIIKRVYNFFLGPKRYKYLPYFVRKYKCKKIMEIGVWNAEHSLEMIKEAKKIHGTEVEYFGFDLFESMTDKIYENEVAKRPPTLAFIKKKLNKTNCKIELFKGDTSETLPKLVKKIPKMDLIYIDGGHSVDTIKNDWEYSKKLLHENTVVIFDDYWNRNDVGCKKIIDNLPKKYKTTVLPVQDKYMKKDGLLTINFALVRKS